MTLIASGEEINGKSVVIVEDAKQHFKDNAFYLAKGLYHIQIAKQYYEMVALESKRDVKSTFNLWVGKLNYLINNVYDRMGEKQGRSLKLLLLMGIAFFMMLFLKSFCS